MVSPVRAVNDRYRGSAALGFVTVSGVPARATDENIARLVAEQLQGHPLSQRNRGLVARQLRAIVEELPPARQRAMSRTNRHLLEVADVLDETAARKLSELDP